MKKIFFSAIFSLIITCSIFAQDREYSFSEKFDVGNTAELKIKTSDGFIDVLPSNGNITADHINGDSDFVTSDGYIDLLDVKGATYVHTSDGNIKFRDLKDSISGRTSDGSITGNFLELNGNVKSGTSDGGIRLTLPQGLGLDLKLRGERIQTDLYNFSGSHNKRSIKGTIGNGEFLIDMFTSDGKITLDYE